MGELQVAVVQLPVVRRAKTDQVGRCVYLRQGRCLWEV